MVGHSSISNLCYLKVTENNTKWRKKRLISRHKRHNRDRSAFFFFVYLAIYSAIRSKKHTFSSEIVLASNDIWLCASTSMEPTKLLVSLKIRDHLENAIVAVNTESKYFSHFSKNSFHIKCVINAYTN